MTVLIKEFSGLLSISNSSGITALILTTLSFLTQIGYGNPTVTEAGDKTPIALTISGPTDLCWATNLTATYTVTNLTTGTFNWNLPGNCTMVSGAGSYTITVKFTTQSMGNNISVTNGSSSGNINVSIYYTPAGSVSGPSSICVGQPNVPFSISGGPPATNFSWHVNGPASIPSGSNTQNVNINFASNFTSGSVGATLINGPCVADATSKNVSVGGTLPGTPGSITGSTIVAPGQTSVPYSVGAVTNATSYQWTLPTGTSVASGTGTNNITVNFPSSFSGGTMSVIGSNSVCPGASSPVLTVNPNYLVDPAGPISGPTNFCTTENGGVFTYSVPPILNATSYIWSFDGSVFPQDQYTTRSSIALNFSQANSSTVHISVMGTNSHGNGLSSPTYSVSVSKPVDAAAAISSTSIVASTSIVCPGQTGVPYNVPPIASATSYNWSMPSGASVATGSGTNSITVNFSSGFTGGVITVSGVGGLCGNGATSNLTILLPGLPSTAGTINGRQTLCIGSSNVSYSVPAITNATGYVWSLPTGASIVSGANTNSILVNFSASSASGNVSVYGTNCAGNGISSSFLVTVFNAAPGALGPIQGQNGVCENGTYRYGVMPSASATTYDFIGSGGPFSTSLGSSPDNRLLFFQDNYPTSGLTVKIAGVNACGLGPYSTLDVTVFKKPGAVSAINGPSVVCPGQTNIAYSVNPIANTNTTSWSSSNGVSITRGTDINSVIVNIGNSFTGGQIIAQGVDGACGGGAPAILSLSLPTQPPAVPGTITESAAPCQNVVYSVADVVGVSYVWSIPQSGTIVSGAGTSSITVSYSTNTSGDVSVYGVNCIGNGPTSAKSITALQWAVPLILAPYIRESVSQVGGKMNVADLTSNPLPVEQLNVHTAYYDGIGRSIQTVATQSSPLRKDTTQPIAYDALGRQAKRYLPYADPGENTGMYKGNALKDPCTTVTTEQALYQSSRQFSFYQTGGKVASDPIAYSETLFEASPLNRPSQDFGSGQNWEVNNKSVKHGYSENQDGEVYLFTYDPLTGLVSAGSNGVYQFYGSGLLYVNSTTDEHGNLVIEYTDKVNHTICKKVQYGVDTSNKALYASTYYVYDDFGNLVVVVPPEAVNSALSSFTQN